MTEESTTGKSNIPQLARELLHLPLKQVVPSDTNPRLNLEKEPFEELKKSIFANGLLQPIVVRPKGEVYEIIGGHRRYFALKDLAQQHKSDKRFTRIAVVVVDVPDAMVPVVQLAENLNRSDLSAIEVADGISRAVGSGLEPQQIADSLGWSRRTLNRSLQLAEAPGWLRDFAKEVKVSRRAVDDQGQAVIDPKTGKPVIQTDRHPGLAATYLNELLMLYNVLRDADALQLEEVGGEHFRPQAERATRRLALLCAAEGWTVAKLRAEVKRAKDPTPRQRSDDHAEPARPIIVSNERCILNLRRADSLSASERAEFAAQLTETLARYKFKSITITP